MLAATDYPLLGIFWSMLLLFLWVAWIWILVMILMDVFRRHDIGGFAKTLWVIFLIVVPFFGVFVYILAENNGMVERRRQEQQQLDQYVRDAAATSDGSPTAEINRAKQLLDSGAITHQEFEQLKLKALG